MCVNAIFSFNLISFSRNYTTRKMISLHLIKSNSSPLSVSQSTSHRKPNFVFVSGSAGRALVGFNSCRKSKLRLIQRRFSVSCRVKDGENQSNGEEPPESLFMKELKRRGMNPTSLLEESRRSVTGDDADMKFKEERGGFSNRNAVSTDLEKNLSNQREISMGLNSEGLEGLIPRAKLLLSLGGTFFLAFWPLIILTITLFLGIYLLFGTKFVHDGTDTPVTIPQYIDPYSLLEDERISQTAPRLN